MLRAAERTMSHWGGLLGTHCFIKAVSRLCLLMLAAFGAACTSGADSGAGLADSCFAVDDLRYPPTRSERELRETLSQDEALASVNLDLGRHAIFRRDYDKAQEYFQRALRADAKCGMAYVAWGLALTESVRSSMPPERFSPAQQKKLDDAIEKYAASVALDSGNKNAYAAWGFTLFRKSTNNPLQMPTGVPEPTIEKYRRALEIDPEFHWALSGLSEVYLAYGSTYSSYVRHLRKQNRTEAADPLSGKVQPIGIIEERAISFLETARGAAEKSVRARPDDARARIRWGKILVAQGRMADAIAVFDPLAAMQVEKPLLREVVRYVRVAAKGRDSPTGNALLERLEAKLRR